MELDGTGYTGRMCFLSVTNEQCQNTEGTEPSHQLLTHHVTPEGRGVALFTPLSDPGVISSGA